MATALAIPILLILTLFQMAAVSRLPLVHGSADLVLLALAAWGIQDKARNAWQWALIAGILVSFVSALPWITVLLPYLAIALLARQLHSRIWQSPIFGMLLITIAGTLLQHLSTFITLQFMDISVAFSQVLSDITIPSLILNLILALPIYVLIHDVAGWVYPVEEYE